MIGWIWKSRKADRKTVIAKLSIKTSYWKAAWRPRFGAGVPGEEICDR
jgi:hypothetical protein